MMKSYFKNKIKMKMKNEKISFETQKLHGGLSPADRLHWSQVTK